MTMTTSRPLVLTNAFIVGEAKFGRALCSILIQGERIADISTGEAFPPEDACVIDLQQRCLLPGLIDCHVHPFLADANIARLNDIPTTLMTVRAANILRRMLMRGFTTVRDAAGGDWGVKQAVEEGEILGPRMFIAGRALSQTGGHGDFRRRTDEGESVCACTDALAMTSRIADGVDEIRKAVRDAFRKGADQIKIMVSGGVSSPHDPLERDQYSPQEIEVAVEEAKRRGSYVMAHAYGPGAIKTALKAGVRSIEHGNMIDREGAAIAAQNGAFLVPTLITYDVLAEKASAAGWHQSMIDKLARVREFGCQSIEICRRAGVELGFGTDLLGDDFDRQSEEFRLRAGAQTNAEVIDSATRINAKILQKEGELGVLKPGAIADIIALDGDPIEDIAVLVAGGDRIALVIKNGSIMKKRLSKEPNHMQTVNK